MSCQALLIIGAKHRDMQNTLQSQIKVYDELGQGGLQTSSLRGIYVWAWYAQVCTCT